MIVMIAVSLVFLAPLVDLQPTALRSMKAAFAFFAALTSLACLSFAVCQRSGEQKAFLLQVRLQRSEEVLDLTCSLLC